MLWEKNYSYISNCTYQSKDISIQIHTFPTLFHNNRYFENEISVTFDLEDFGIIILYLEISTPLWYDILFFPFAASINILSIRKLLVCTFRGNLFAAAMERSLWT